MLTTIDHVGHERGRADFKICSRRTNDAKGDLWLDEFVALCESILTANRRRK